MAALARAPAQHHRGSGGRQPSADARVGHREAARRRVPDFRARLDERIAQYSYRSVRRCPRAWRTRSCRPAPTRSGRSATRRSIRRHAARGAIDEAPFESEGRFVKKRRARPAHDGSSGRSTRWIAAPPAWRWSAGTSAAPCRCAHPAAGEHRSRRDEPAIAVQRRRGTGPRRAFGQGVAAEPRSDAAAGDLPLGRRPLAGAVPRHAAHVRLADPALGFRRLPRDEFERRWTGYAALFDYTPAFEQAPRAAAASPGCGRSSSRTRRCSCAALGLARRRQRAADGAAGLHAGDRRSRAGRAGPVAAPAAHRRHGRRRWSFIVASLAGAAISAQFCRPCVSTPPALDYITRRLLALPMSYFATRRTGDLQRRIEGMRQVRDLLVQHGIAGVTAVAQLAVTVALMSVYSPWLALVFLATAPLYALLMVGRGRGGCGRRSTSSRTPTAGTTRIRSTRSRASRR